MIAIESLAVEDFALVASWLSKAEVNGWLSSEWRDRAIDSATVAIAVRNRRNRFWLVSCEGSPCGIVVLSDVDMDDRVAMLWYVLGESMCAGKGITSAAVARVCDVAFGELGMRCIYAWIMQPNIASRRVLEKCGFREVGRLRRATSFQGNIVDRVYFDRVSGERSQSS